MVSTSGKHLFCFIHMGGKFINNGDNEMRYVGGSVRTRCIKECTSYEELKKIISSIMGKESNSFVLKFSVVFDENTFVELVDDNGVEHLIKFNDKSGHVYVEENENNDHSEVATDGAMEEQDVFDQYYEGVDELCLSPLAMVNEIGEPPLISCAVEIILTQRPEINAAKWKDLVIGEGQIFPNATALRRTLYKYSKNPNPS